MEVIKASGEKVPFRVSKLQRSLEKSGATNEQINDIVSDVELALYPGISTKAIYQEAFSLLKDKEHHLAARYTLKTSIMELGPEGHLFERLVGEVLSAQGYSTSLRQIIEGHCVQHEIDVIAEINDARYMIECKFHNQLGTSCDVKIPLYIQSRFRDVEMEPQETEKRRFHQGWVVTNTRFTDDAIQYGTCIGLRLIGWNYPAKGGLRDKIDELGLYPVTCLTSLTSTEKQALLSHNVLLCKEIDKNEKIILGVGIGQGRLDEVLKEVNTLCYQNNFRETRIPKQIEN